MSPSQFKALQAEWDRKLQESGFKDIEDRRTGLLKGLSGSNVPEEVTLRNHSTLVERAEYYRQCRHFLEGHLYKVYPSPCPAKWKTVWNLHSKGVPYRAIVKETGMCLGSVQHVIRVLRRKMFNTSSVRRSKKVKQHSK